MEKEIWNEIFCVAPNAFDNFKVFNFHSLSLFNKHFSHLVRFKVSNLIQFFLEKRIFIFSIILIHFHFYYLEYLFNSLNNIFLLFIPNKNIVLLRRSPSKQLLLVLPRHCSKQLCTTNSLIELPRGIWRNVWSLMLYKC